MRCLATSAASIFSRRARVAARFLAGAGGIFAFDGVEFRLIKVAFVGRESDERCSFHVVHNFSWRFAGAVAGVVRWRRVHVLLSLLLRSSRSWFCSSLAGAVLAAFRGGVPGEFGLFQLALPMSAKRCFAAVRCG